MTKTITFLTTYIYPSSVVALFNAIAKTKKDAAEKEAAEKSKDKPEGRLFLSSLTI